MSNIKNSASVTAPTELTKLSICMQQKFYHNFNSYNELTQAEKQKRDIIFRCLITELRTGRFESDGDFSDVVFDLPKLVNSKNFSSLDDEEIYSLGVCYIPNFIVNALISQKLTKRFGDLSVCGCFVKIDDVWRLDIDEHLSKRGLFLPVRDREGLIYGLRVYRYPDDKKSFLLKVRGDRNYG